MRVPIRQGIISAPTVASAPAFLVNNAGAIDISLNNVPVIFAFAHGQASYLASEQVNVPQAWSEFSAVGTNYLYWELNENTGRIVRASTPISPVTAGGPPPDPVLGQMWFNTGNTTMYVWTRRRDNSEYWASCIRVFAGTAEVVALATESQPNQISAVNEYILGSQAGLEGTFNNGYVLRDGANRPIRVTLLDMPVTEPPMPQFKFLTSDDEMITTGLDGSIVKLQNTTIYVRAGEPLLVNGFSLVYVYAVQIDENIELFAGLASSLPDNYQTRAPIGLVAEQLNESEVGALITGGIVYNDQWTWTADDVGRAVYCGPTGELTTTKPGTLKTKRVATVISPREILLAFDWETDFGGVGEQGPQGASGFSGYSGTSGFSGYSGINGLNGSNGASGYSGINGASGYSGIDGTVGTSGYSGATGTNGFSGYSGVSPTLAINNYTANRIVGLVDVNAMVRMNVANPNTVTIAPDADVPWGLGDTIIISQVGVGLTTIVAGAGVTINTPSTLALGMRWGKVTATRVAANEWDIEGNLAAV